MTQVVNYDLPSNTDDYVHRIGRTGRAGRTGNVRTYVTRDEELLFKKLVKHVGIEKIDGAKEILEHFKENPAPKGRDDKGRGRGRSGDKRRDGDKKKNSNNRRRRKPQNKDKTTNSPEKKTGDKPE